MIALDELSARALARDAALPAIEFEGRCFDWGSMRRVTDRLGRLIDASGARAGAPVAFVARTRPSALAALLGLIARNHTIRMIYPFQSAAGIGRDVERLKPAVIVAAAEDLSDALIELLRTLGIATIAIREMDAFTVPGLERSQPPGDPDIPPQPRIEILTSGTTGPPKQFGIRYDVIARHYIAANTSDDLREAEMSRLPPALLYFPLGNISGIYTTLPPLLKGLRIILLDKFTVRAWHDYVLRYRPTAFGLPPAGVQMLLDADIPKADLASIRVLSTGAAPLDPTVQRAFEERYGIPVLLSYGATEFVGPVTAMTAELHAQWGASKFGSVGRALPGAQLRITDPETGAALPPGREGIVEVISPRVGPEWIRTSDIGMLDEDGFLFHRGRADGAIVRGGFKLMPETIERALLLHPAISAAAVVGVPDPRLTQIPAAAIKLRPGAAQPTVADLEKHLRDHVPATHIPVIWRFVEALPTTPSFKVDRPALRRLLAE
ncbi:MAG: class I adenylate-forming enzyme family protein [Steroidobacteraceae bacterium]